jgi:hypothetical protein
VNNSLSNLGIKEQMDEWMDIYYENLEKLDIFFTEKFKDIQKDLVKLKEKIENKKIKGIEKMTEISLLSVNNNITNSDAIFSQKHRRITDEMAYASSFMRAITDLYVQSSWLEGFANINEVAGRMLCKKINVLLCIY